MWTFLPQTHRDFTASSQYLLWPAVSCIQGSVGVTQQGKGWRKRGIKNVILSGSLHHNDETAHQPPSGTFLPPSPAPLSEETLCTLLESSKESSVEPMELGNMTLCRHPLGESKFSWGREMAFLMMGETSGGMDDKSRESPRGRGTEFFRTCRKVRVKNPVVLELFAESGLPGSLLPP
ncbi:hypothetical protein FQN60_003553 [Etheostoma spectabile]|uniref:Uncharacterized protein n=1 Tax=Etheostoma spectabile TaxID=54343 RepID=A0A5J5CUS8_9PERO|nr:hypothetical protein FQN60_003553 [Etheostoma spectabile]